MDARNIKDLISRNQWETVFTALKKIESNDENWGNQVVQLEGRYRYLKQQKAQGVLTTDEVNIEFNRLRESILSLIQDLTPEPLPPPIFNLKVLLILGFVLIGIVSFVYLSRGNTDKTTHEQEQPQQKHTLEGAIQCNGEDVEGVEVRIDGTESSTLTNAKGMFKLELSPANKEETFLISLKKKGYETRKETYEMRNNQLPIYNLTKE
jgi:type II secretory pathway component PulM